MLYLTLILTKNWPTDKAKFCMLYRPIGLTGGLQNSLKVGTNLQNPLNP